MRKILILLTIIVILPCFSIVCAAQGEVDKYVFDFEGILPEGFEDLTDADGIVEKADVESLLSHIITVISGERGSIATFFLLLLGSAMLISLASSSQMGASETARSTVGVVCSILIFGSVSPLLNNISESITSISNFFASLIPIILGITALGGGVATASAQAVGMYTALSAVGGVGVRLFLTISAFGLAVSLLSAVGNDNISAVCRGLRSLFGWVCGIFTAIITAAFSLQTIVTSSLDSASMRAVRYAASGLIPVVGSTVSGAISTLASGLSYAKSIIGGGAILVILYLSLSPLTLLLLYRLALTVATVFSDFADASAASGIFNSFRFSLDMMITVYALSALIYLFEIIIFTVVGVAVL